MAAIARSTGADRGNPPSRSHRVFRLIEQTLAVVDSVAAIVLAAVAGLASIVPVVFGGLSYLDKGTVGGHEWTLALGVTFAATGGVFLAAALAMRRRTRWRWWLQAATLPTFSVLFSITTCLGGAGVRVGPFLVCGP